MTPLGAAIETVDLLCELDDHGVHVARDSTGVALYTAPGIELSPRIEALLDRHWPRIGVILEAEAIARTLREGM